MPLQYSHKKEPWEATFNSPNEQMKSRQDIAKFQRKKHREANLLTFLLWTIAFGIVALLFFQSIYE